MPLFKRSAAAPTAAGPLDRRPRAADRKAAKGRPLTSDTALSPFLAEHTRGGLTDRLAELNRRADLRDTRTLRALEDVGGWVGVGAAVLTNALNPATIVLTVFAATGTAIFHFFGITIPAFRVAGGILLFTIALEMMRARISTWSRFAIVRTATAADSRSTSSSPGGSWLRPSRRRRGDRN